jgi:hypothetical protein
VPDVPDVKWGVGGGDDWATLISSSAVVLNSISDSSISANCNLCKEVNDGPDVCC